MQAATEQNGRGAKAYKAARRGVVDLVGRVLCKRNERLEWLYDQFVRIRWCRNTFGKAPNLTDPQTFNEKIAYRILYDRRPLLTTLVDKVAVRSYVADRIGPDYLTRLYAVTDDPEKIDVQALPESFVIKSNHGSGMNMVVLKKSEWEFASALPVLRKWLASNYYTSSREWAYRDVPPQLIVEELLAPNPLDWKFFVFSGRCEILKVIFDRATNQTSNLYDRQLNRLPVRWKYDNHPEDPVFPANIDEMFSVAETLGRDWDFLRVDLYNIEGRIVFGELTVYVAGGLEVFEPSDYDLEFGRLWKLRTS